MATAPTTYAIFLDDPSRRDVYLYTVTVVDDTGTTQTLRWATKAFTSEPTDTPAEKTWEERVAEGGIDYESPSFDPHEPEFGIAPAVQPSPLVVYQLEDEDTGKKDLDAKMAWRWTGAKIVVQHGGWTDEGQLPLSAFATIATLEVDEWPLFDLDRVTFPLRSYDARFDALVERRALAALGWCIEGDGTQGEVAFYPFAPGVRMRDVVNGNTRSNAASGADVIVTMPGNIVAGDLLVVFISSHGNGGTPYINWAVSSAPAGWTYLDDAVVTVSAVAAHRCYCYYRVATGTETATYTWTGTGTACNRNWSCSVWYGQDGTTPMPATADASGGPGTSIVAPTVTTVRNGDVLLSAWSSATGWDGDLPDGMTEVARKKTNTTGGNSSSLVVGSETIATAGATGTRTIADIGTTRYASLSVVVGNKAAGGQVTKLELEDTMTAQFAFIPFAITGGTQQIFGWETTPFRCYLDSSGHLNWAWVKSSTPVTKTTAFTFVAWRRYHVDVIHNDTTVIFRIYDWLNDSLTEETFTGSGFNGRDSAGATDKFTYLYDDNGGSGASYFDGQLWSVRIWNVQRDKDVLDDTRMRPLTASETLDSTLVHYVPFIERTGTIIGDLSNNPADGLIGKGGDWRPTLTGNVDQVGQRVPCVFGGPVEHWPGVSVDSDVDGAFFIVHPVKAHEIDAIYEGGAPRSVSVEYEDEEYRDFIDTLPDVGTYTTYRGDLGTFYRCRTIPVLRSTCRIYGDAYNGTFVDKLGDIIRRVITTRGEEPIVDPTGLDTGSFATLNTDVPHPIDGGVGYDETIENFVRRIGASASVVLWSGRDGKFYIKQWAGVDGTGTVKINRKTILRNSIRILDVKKPVRKVSISFRRNWSPMKRDEISGDVTDENTLRFLLDQWRSLIVRRWVAANRYPRARELDIESYFTNFWHAAPEANRIADLYDTPPQCIELSVRQVEAKTELFDIVNLVIADLDPDGVPRSRLYTGTGDDYVVTYVRDDRMRGLETLRLWRQDSTVEGSTGEEVI